MKLRTLFATATLALASLVSAPAFASPMPHEQPRHEQHATVAIAGVPTRGFVEQVRGEMNSIVSGARTAVEHHELRPQVLNALRGVESRIESSLRGVERRPTVSAPQARQIQGQVNQMQALTARYATRTARR